MNLLSLGAFSLAEFCLKLGEIVQIAGYVFLVIKIAIPVLIIAYGVLDFGKAVISEKEDDIKKYAKRLVYRVIGGIIIFLLPSIVLWIFELTSGYNNVMDTSTKASWKNCKECFLNPLGDCNIDSSFGN